jgi:hypothetical protein
VSSLLPQHPRQRDQDDGDRHDGEADHEPVAAHRFSFNFRRYSSGLVGGP